MKSLVLKRLVAVFLLVASGLSLSACGCGPLGLAYCGGGYGRDHGGGGYGGGGGGHEGGGRHY